MNSKHFVSLEMRKPKHRTDKKGGKGGHRNGTKKKEKQQTNQVSRERAVDADTTVINHRAFLTPCQPAV